MGCGGVLPVSEGRGRPRKWCFGCRPAGVYPVGDRSVDVKCSHCGSGFDSGPRRGPIGRYCSVGCRAAASRLRYPPSGVALCVRCGKDFPRPVSKAGQFANQKFCSSECRLKAGYERRMADALPCARCGDALPVPGHRRKYCSDDCSRKNMSGNTHRRRAKRHGVDYEKVDPLAVFERDGWVCGLCGEPVDRRLQWPHPLSASQDHIVPISRGGSHTFDNVQCAHLECNLLARTKAG